jgi:hypothetical protein
VDAAGAIGADAADTDDAIGADAADMGAADATDAVAADAGADSAIGGDAADDEGAAVAADIGTIRGCGNGAAGGYRLNCWSRGKLLKGWLMGGSGHLLMIMPGGKYCRCGMYGNRRGKGCGCGQ